MIFGREIPPVGSGKIYILGEAPGEKEERAGVPFVGAAGNLLFGVLSRLGVHRTQCRIGNVFWRRPPFNSIAKAKETPDWERYCIATREDLKRSSPSLILALGSTALNLLFPGSSIDKLRGYLLDWNGIPVISTYHPAAVLRDQDLLLPFQADLRKAVHFVNGLLSPVPPPKLYLDDHIALEEAIRFLLDRPDKLAACDIEISETSPFRWTMSIFGLSYENDDGEPIAVNARPLRAQIPLIKKLVEETGSRLIFHNAPFDLAWLKGEFDINPTKAPHDTMIMSHILLPDQKKALEYATSLWLLTEAWKHLSEEDPFLYNAYDCYNTLLLYRELSRQIESLRLASAYEQKRKELLPAIFMSLLGCRLDEAKRQELILKVQEEQSRVLEQIYELEPRARSYNLGSHQQLKQFLFSDLKLPPQLKKGKLTTDADAIKALKRKVRDKNPKAFKILSLYQEWRKLKDIESKELKVLSTQWTGRIHTTYNVIGTISARWSSSSPAWGNKKGAKARHGTNFQNRSKPYRSFYLPPKEGWIFIGADYGGAEARIVAYRCNDEQSKRAFAEGRDIHKLTASLMFGISEDSVTKELRSIGKRIRHAANYDMSWRKLADLMEISAAEAKDLLSRYHAAFPKIRSVFHQKTAQIVQTQRELRDAWGLRLPFFGRIDAEVLREAYAFYPQSTCTHTLNKALLRLWEWTKDKKWVALQFQIHDELVLTCEPDAAEEVAEAIASAMAIEIPIWDLDQEEEVPLVLPIEFKLGSNWGDMIEFESLSQLPDVLAQLKED